MTTIRLRRWAPLLAAMLIAAPATAQISTVDPNAAYSTTMPGGAPAATTTAPRGGSIAYPADTPAASEPRGTTAPTTATDFAPADESGDPAATATVPASPATTAPITSTYQEGDLLSAAEGVFGKGAEGLGKILERILKDQGEPSAYIGGREVGGAFVAGLRYGSGTLSHKVEGQRPVFWTGPSVGFDFGANGAKTFVLVYNLYDSQELFRRYPAAEGTAYVIGGFTASYLRRGDVVLIPIRLGVGWRLGVNVGYMRFSETSKISPF